MPSDTDLIKFYSFYLRHFSSGIYLKKYEENILLNEKASCKST